MWSSRCNHKFPLSNPAIKRRLRHGQKFHIGSRSDAERPGTFGIVMEAGCHPRPGYPRGEVKLIELDMTDSWVRGVIVATTIDQMTSTGGRAPMAFLSGRCQVRHIGPPIVEVEPSDLQLDAELADVELDGTVDPAVHQIPLPNPYSGCRYWIMLADNQEGGQCCRQSSRYCRCGWRISDEWKRPTHCAWKRPRSERGSFYFTLSKLVLPSPTHLRGPGGVP